MTKCKIPAVFTSRQVLSLSALVERMLVLNPLKCQWWGETYFRHTPDHKLQQMPACSTRYRIFFSSSCSRSHGETTDTQKLYQVSVFTSSYPQCWGCLVKHPVPLCSLLLFSEICRKFSKIFQILPAKCPIGLMDRMLRDAAGVVFFTKHAWMCPMKQSGRRTDPTGP